MNNEPQSENRQPETGNPAEGGNRKPKTENRPPASRIVLLGASNVANAFPMLMHWFHRHWPGPREIFAAFGHGRSYGIPSKLLFVRELPGITESGLFPRLAECEPAPTSALITDVGNDLLFDVPAPQILEWVEQCIEKLQAMDADIVMTLPPLERVRELKAWQYYPIRTVMFPGRRIRYAELQQGIEDLSEGLVALGEKHEVPTVKPRREWYGADPIHILKKDRPAAWGEVFSRWRDCPAEPLCFPKFGENRQMNRLQFAERRFFGKTQTQPQPALEWEQSAFFLF